jgi:hypothetical protein
MGAEAQCRARWGNQVSDGKALLETDRLIFRGAFRLSIPLANLKSISTENGHLIVHFPDGVASFELGPTALKWAKKILNPPQRVDKLGIKQRLRIGILGVRDPTFHDEVVERTASVLGKSAKDLDIAFLAVEKKPDLKKLPATMKALKSTGALWIVYAKGVSQITEAEVLRAGRAAGLTDIKVVRFSETHTGLKFVIPVARRR